MMAEPFLTLVAKVRRAGRRPVTLSVDSDQLANPTPVQIANEIDECFRKLKQAVREELTDE